MVCMCVYRAQWGGCSERGSGEGCSVRARRAEHHTRASRPRGAAEVRATSCGEGVLRETPPRTMLARAVSATLCVVCVFVCVCVLAVGHSRLRVDWHWEGGVVCRAREQGKGGRRERPRALGIVGARAEAPRGGRVAHPCLFYCAVFDVRLMCLWSRRARICGRRFLRVVCFRLTSVRFGLSLFALRARKSAGGAWGGACVRSVFLFVNSFSPLRGLFESFRSPPSVRFFLYTLRIRFFRTAAGRSGPQTYRLYDSRSPAPGPRGRGPVA